MAEPHTRYELSKELMKWAAEDGETLATCKTLLDRGAMINKFPVLMWVCRKTNYETIEFLLEHNTDPNQPGDDGFTPLHVACHLRNGPIARLLIDYGAKPLVNCCDDYSDSVQAAAYSASYSDPRSEAENWGWRERNAFFEDLVKYCWQDDTRQKRAQAEARRRAIFM